MKNLFKNRLVTILIVSATVVLAGIAIFTAIRLYQLRKESVSPGAPESKPEAQEAQPPDSYRACSPLQFTIEKKEAGLVCKKKKVYKNNAKNKPGEYYLEEELVAGSKVAKSQTLIYALFYENTGTGTSKGAVITDTLPAEVKFVDSDAECSYKTESKSVICEVDEVVSKAKSNVSFRVKVLGAVQEGKRFKNKAEMETKEGKISSCAIALIVKEAATATPTATPTEPPEDEETPTPTATPTESPTAEPEITPVPTESPIPTEEPALPEAGISYPTVLGISIGAILLILSLALAL